MTTKTFQEALTTWMQQTPYEVFTIELNTGEQIQIDHVDAISTREGKAVFIGPGGKIHIFDHESVNQVFVPANLDN